MRGYVESLEAAARGLPLNGVERALLARPGYHQQADADLDEDGNDEGD